MKEAGWELQDHPGMLREKQGLRDCASSPIEFKGIFNVL